MKGLTPAAILRGLAVGGLVVAWALLAHYGSAGNAHSDFSVALTIVPILALLIILLWRVGHAWAIALGGIALLAGLALSWPVLRQNIALLYYLQHLGTNLALAALFGRTLLGGGEALVTHFAKLAHDGQISPAKTRYTRQVTVAWTSFFLLNAAISSLLFGLASPAAWSIFANLLSLPLLALMFAGEHLIRYRVLAADDRSSMADTIRGYRASLHRRKPQ